MAIEPAHQPTERPYHHGNLRSALLAAAERRVRERGVQDLSLRELAREIGVSHGAPRRHFPDRQALLDALAESGFERLGAELRAAADRAGDEFQPRLEAIAAAYIRFATADPALLDLMFASKHRATEQSLDDAMEGAFLVLIELILQGQAIGRLAPGDPERVGLVLFSTIQGITALLTAGMITPEQLDELTTDAIANFLRGSAPTSSSELPEGPGCG
ncbi:MAG TPA: TetR/AcrR family transcriptional regulator [Solirubrobacteraceae bacterium]|jgi:AcrR family transcriptional regulator|nr:TetR/AcrR family transcriptional regulator [Solirubrobacteraceae bacterium]